MMRRRWALLAPVLLGLLALLIWRPDVPRVTVARVVAQPLEQRLVATGRVMSPERIELGSLILGSVEQVLVEEGAPVAPGQPLIRLASEEAAAAVHNAEAALNQARAELRQLERVSRPELAESRNQAELQLEQARRDYRRARALAEEGFVSTAEAEARKDALDLAASRLRSARQALLGVQPHGSGYQSAVARLAGAEALLAEARTRLDYTVIRAPAAATVIAREVEPGDIVQPGAPLLLLASAGETLLEVPIDERNLGRLRLGQPALASADAYPQERFPATVSFIGPAVDPQRGTVEAKLTVAEPPPYLRADMTVSVDIQVARRERALSVPREAVHQSEGNGWVLVVRHGRAVRQAVELGLIGDARVELLGGVAPDEPVLLDPTAVTPGRRVRISEETG